MQALTPQRMAASAYRTLGLPGCASQVQIEAAARRLRIWPDPNTVPPTPWDCTWLGPVARSKNDIEQAFAALNEPATRIEERLLWFHGSDASLWAARDAKDLDPALRTLSTATDPPSFHDFSLARLQLALLHDFEVTDPDRWRRVLKRLCTLAASDDYLAWLLKVEDQGDFEKRAEIEEVSAALKAWPQSLAASLAGRAEAALENDDFPTASRIIGLLRTSEGQSVAAVETETRILDRLEDLVERRSAHLQEDLGRKFNRGTISVTQGQAFCGGAAKFYNESIDPVLSEVYALAGPHSDRTLRARTAAAKAMALMGEAWAACRRFQIADQTLQAAILLAEGSPLENGIRQTLERCRQNALRTSAASPGGRPGSGQTRTYKPVYSTVGASGGGRGWAGGTGILILVSVVVRGLIGFGSLGGSSNSTPPSYTPGNSYRYYGTPSRGVRFAPDGTPTTDNPGNSSDDTLDPSVTRLDRFTAPGMNHLPRPGSGFSPPGGGYQPPGGPGRR